jgi:hypothetical protein
VKNTRGGRMSRQRVGEFVSGHDAPQPQTDGYAGVLLAVGARPIALELLKPVSRRHPQIVERLGSIQEEELMPRTLKTAEFAVQTPHGETGTRTRDTTIFSRVLYQLSYLAADPILPAEPRSAGPQPRSQASR